MGPLTWLAIYLMIWWVSFFAVLPLWNISHHEAGVKTTDGGDPGAPLTHNLKKKVWINTLVAAALCLVLFVFMTFVHIPLPAIPG
jgi:predicted secreted protein